MVDGLAIPLLAAIFLWHKSVFVARTLMPKSGVEQIPINLSESALFTVLSTILGFYLVITGGADLAGSVALHFATITTNLSATFIPAPFVRPTLELFLGLALVLRTKGLMRMYFFLKEAGLKSKVNSN